MCSSSSPRILSKPDHVHIQEYVVQTLSQPSVWVTSVTYNFFFLPTTQSYRKVCSKSTLRKRAILRDFELGKENFVHAL